MKRAVILVTSLTLLCGVAGWLLDSTQTTTARTYLSRLPQLRQALLAEDYEAAWLEQAELHARWEQDAVRLNALVSHHHTRAVSTAMLNLATAIELRLQPEALQALDALWDALGDVESSDALRWENLL